MVFRVTLLGTTEDYVQLCTAIKELPLADIGLAFWKRSLHFIADNILATAKGEEDVSFWKSWYKYGSFSEGQAVNGWVAHLFPFVRNENTWQQNKLGISSVPFIWRLPLQLKEHKMKLLAGFGVPAVAERDVAPQLGWAVCYDRTGDAMQVSDSD